MKDKSPAFQWYVKQLLGDDKVLAMDWDAVGMHVWLLNLSWQQEPPGSIPDDLCIIRRWLRLPSGFADADRVWARVWPQINAAWALKDGRWFNSGMVRAWERQQTYKQNGSKPKAKREQSLEDEDIDSKKKKEKVISHWDGKTEPPESLGLDDICPELLNQLGIGLNAANRNAAYEALRLKSEQPGWTLPRAFVHVYQRGEEFKKSPKFKSEFKKSWANWLLNGDYDTPESWNGKGSAHVTETGQTVGRGFVPYKKKDDE